MSASNNGYLFSFYKLCFISTVRLRNAEQTLTTLSLYSLVQDINEPTHRCGHIIDWVIVRPDDDIDVYIRSL